MGVGVDVDLSLGTTADRFTDLRRQISRGDAVEDDLIPHPHAAIPLNRHYHRIFSVGSGHRYGVNNLWLISAARGQIWSVDYSRHEREQQDKLNAQEGSDVDAADEFRRSLVVAAHRLVN
jgi:hypothetical protein